MRSMTSELWPLAKDEDIVLFRQAVHRVAREAGYGTVDQTKLVTAASEIARNALEHGGGGEASIMTITQDGRSGIKVVVRDQGAGIADIKNAMRDGYTSGKGMGLGLGGAKRLADEMEVRSTPVEGTTVTLIRWK